MTKDRKIKGEYPFDTLLKIMREMGNFTSELIFCYPSIIERNLALAKSSNRDDDLKTCYSIIDRLQKEAASTLKSRGYPTDLESLKSLKDYNPMTGEEADADIQVMNARQVLILAPGLKEIIKAGSGEEVFFETLKLLAAALTASVQPFALRGISSAVGTDKSHTKGKLKGVMLAVEQIRREYPALTKKRQGIWDHLRKLDKAGEPWTATDEGAAYSITFPGKDAISLTTKTEKGEKTETLTKKTFIQKYCIPGDSEPEPEKWGCDENGMPLDPLHHWNK